MSELTIQEILKSWVYVGNTQAHGKHYHDAKTDRAAVVYVGYAKVFSNRRQGITGNTASCYDDCNHINASNNKL
jgi:hypothetical protein